MTTLMQASHQWATRPSDQRFVSLDALHEYTSAMRARSVGRAVSSRSITAQPVDGDSRALQVVGPDGSPANVTNWAFGQLAQRAGAPAGYLRGLPGAMAADCLNYGMHVARDVEDVGVLLYKGDDGAAQLRAATGPNYGRIWNETVTRALRERFGDGLTGDFRVPGEFGKHVDVTKENTTLYASDRDMFVFLADEKNRIEIPNRRNGEAGSLARGFFVWNSEVGSATLGIGTFLFDFVCCNRMVWGATQYGEVRIRHTAGAPDRWLEDAIPALEAYREGGTDNIVKAISGARAARIDNVDDFLARRFTRSIAASVKVAHLADEDRPIETLWDAANGVTAYARSVPHQDARVLLEREAGRILEMAA